MVLEINSLKQLEEKIKEYPNAIVDFYATWCGPCKAIAPKIHKLAEDNKKIGFFKVDVDQAEDLAAHFKIEAMPTFIVFKGGKQHQTIVGANIGKIEAAVKELH